MLWVALIWHQYSSVIVRQREEKLESNSWSQSCCTSWWLQFCAVVVTFGVSVVWLPWLVSRYTVVGYIVCLSVGSGLVSLGDFSVVCGVGSGIILT